MNNYRWILFPTTAFLMTLSGRVSGDENTDNTGNYDYVNSATPAPLYFDDKTNALFYPDGYQNWYNGYQLQKAGFGLRQPQILSRQAFAGIPLQLVAAVGGAVANAAYTLTSTSDLQTKLDTSNSDKKTLCNKVNSIIAIGAPGALPSTAGTVAQSTPNSITSAILPAGDTYSIKAVTDAGVTPTSTTAANGLAAYTAEKGTVNGQDTTALSITTFNTFRKQVADALNTLDAKIRQVTNLAQLTC